MLSVEPHVRRVVDAVEDDRQLFAGSLGRHGEAGAIPIVLPRELFRNREIVEPVIRIGIDTAIDQGLQHRSRHGRGIPFACIIAGARQRCAVPFHVWRGSKAPAVDLPPVARDRLQRRLRENRPGHWLLVGALALRQRPSRLIFGQADIGALLKRPGLPNRIELDEREIGARGDLRAQRAGIERAIVGSGIDHLAAKVRLAVDRRGDRDARIDRVCGCPSPADGTAIEIQRDRTPIADRGDMAPLARCDCGLADDRGAAVPIADPAIGQQERATGAGRITERDQHHPARLLLNRIDPGR